MKRLTAIVLALALAAAACGDSGSASSCDELVDEAVDLFQDALDSLADLTLEDAAELGDELPEEFETLETRGEELEAQSEELGCSEAELQARFDARVGDLTAEGPVAELILGGLLSESDAGSLFGGGG
jgi:hypothetical protein